jgi:hypothetical protein
MTNIGSAMMAELFTEKLIKSKIAHKGFCLLVDARKGGWYEKSRLSLSLRHDYHIQSTRGEWSLSRHFSLA